MNVKKTFQKTVSEIRKDWRVKRNTPGGEYPKAMMTSQQEAKNTATVNCGGEWVSSSFSKDLAEYVINDERFQKFLSDAGAEATIEKVYGRNYVVPGCQVRISFLR